MKTIEEHYRNGQLYKKYTINKDGHKHGLYEDWHTNGELKIRANYKDGQRHGLFEFWYDNGQRFIKSNYKDGRIHGLYEAWNGYGEQTEKQYYINYQKVTEKEWEEYLKITNE